MTVDLQRISTKAALHELLKQRLGFPDWAGANWDAFWDCVTAMVPMPAEVRLLHWQEYAACPHDMEILRQVLASYARDMSGKQIVLVPEPAAA